MGLTKYFFLSTVIWRFLSSDYLKKYFNLSDSRYSEMGFEQYVEIINKVEGGIKAIRQNLVMKEGFTCAGSFCKYKMPSDFLIPLERNPISQETLQRQSKDVIDMGKSLPNNPKTITKHLISMVGEQRELIDQILELKGIFSPSNKNPLHFKSMNQSEKKAKYDFLILQLK